MVKEWTFGIKGNFGQSAYMADHLYAQNGIGEAAIAQAVKDLQN